jgi:hypothetical protein
METETSAARRGARVLAEVLAYDSRFQPDLRAGLEAGLDSMAAAGVDLRGIRWAFVSPNAGVGRGQREVLSARTSATILDAVNRVAGECYSAQGALHAAAVLADPGIEPGQMALLSAAGFDGGVSQLVLRKR